MRYIVAILPALFLFFLSSGMCQDELYLSGHVVSYDKSTGIVTVDVATPGCEGLRQFYLRGDFDEGSVKVGKKIYFYINAPECQTGRIHEMIFKRR